MLYNDHDFIFPFQMKLIYLTSKLLLASLLKCVPFVVYFCFREKKTSSEKVKIEDDKKLEKKDLNIAEDFENSDAVRN